MDRCFDAFIDGGAQVENLKITVRAEKIRFTFVARLSELALVVCKYTVYVGYGARVLSVMAVRACLLHFDRLKRQNFEVIYTDLGLSQ